MLCPGLNRRGQTLLHFGTSHPSRSLAGAVPILCSHPAKRRLIRGESRIGRSGAGDYRYNQEVEAMAVPKSKKSCPVQQSK
jgi:hypothetical protein